MADLGSTPEAPRVAQMRLYRQGQSEKEGETYVFERFPPRPFVLIPRSEGRAGWDWVVKLIDPFGNRAELRGRPVHLRYESATTISRLFQTQGLSNICLLWLPIMPAPLARFQWLLETRAARWLFRRAPLLGMLLSHSFVVVGVMSDEC
jgi:hypothetical protein